MPSNVNDRYLETRVMSASPLELVRMLYDAAQQAVRDARRHLAAGDIAARSGRIFRAIEVLAELSGSLDRGRGGEIARQLAELYDYMQRRLIDANIRQTDEPLAEVLGLLEMLSSAWQEAAAGPAAEPSRAPEKQEAFCAAGYGGFMTGPAYAVASQSWSA
jgi:flagellar protein FliS